MMKATDDLSKIPCIILCGGQGTRLRDVTELLPKPMVPIGDFPIVVHIMKWYMKFGVKKFILCLGYKKEIFIQYFTNFINNMNDIAINLKTRSISTLTNNILDCEIYLIDTKINAKTGTRIKYAYEKYLLNYNQFFITYGDGLADINIHNLYKEHITSNKLLTLSSVKNPCRFGITMVDNDNNIVDFNEKQYHDSRINGGFMIANKNFIEKYLSDEDQFFESEPFSLAIKNHDIHAYLHNGFWQCMDTPKDYQLLTDIWNTGNAPWKT